MTTTEATDLNAARRAYVNGQLKLPVGGHEECP